MRSLLALVVSLGALSMLVWAAEGPERAVPQPHIGEMNIQTFPGLKYYYTEADSSFATIADTVGKAFAELGQAVQDGAVKRNGPSLLVYDDAHFNARMDRVFKMQIGIVAQEGARPAGNFKVRTTEPFKCATVLYTGPVQEQGQAYQKLYAAIARAGLTRTTEEREMCLYLEGRDSPNNVFLIQVGIK